MPLASPERMTVKVNGVMPEAPSSLFASLAVIASEGVSSSRIVPVAEAGLREKLPLTTGMEAVRFTAKPSSNSWDVSPRTAMVIVRVATPGSKMTTPPGIEPPTKSWPLAGWSPLPTAW